MRKANVTFNARLLRFLACMLMQSSSSSDYHNNMVDNQSYKNLRDVITAR